MEMCKNNVYPHYAEHARADNDDKRRDETFADAATIRNRAIHKRADGV